MVCGFAQKSKRKAASKSPKSEYFVMTINGVTTLATQYCPEDTITFGFKQMVTDTNIHVLKYCWRDYYHYTDICNVDSIKLAYQYNPNNPEGTQYRVFLDFYLEIATDTVLVLDTLTLMTEVNIDYIRTTLDTSVCEGGNITIHTLHGDETFYNVTSTIQTKWDKLTSVSGCDSLVRWQINVDEYTRIKHSISSCDSVVWGDIVIRKPQHIEGDTTFVVERLFLSTNPDYCDTLRILYVTIIDSGILIKKFDQNSFCSKDDPSGKIELETNYTAFDWKYYPIALLKGEPDTTFTTIIKDIEIRNAGYYYVWAYMDTSLYDTLKDLRIVNNCSRSDTVSVKDCQLIIPNVFTPNGDDSNDVFGIKKLNLKRENELTIYDRWGKNVFHKKNYNCVYRGGKYENVEEAFDGKSRDGRDLPEGTYYYALKYKAFPKTKTYTGTLMILRGKKQ